MTHKSAARRNAHITIYAWHRLLDLQMRSAIHHRHVLWTSRFAQRGKCIDVARCLTAISRHAQTRLVHLVSIVMKWENYGSSFLGECRRKTHLYISHGFSSISKFRILNASDVLRCPNGEFVSRNPQKGCKFDPCDAPCTSDIKVRSRIICWKRCTICGRGCAKIESNYLLLWIERND